MTSSPSQLAPSVGRDVDRASVPVIDVAGLVGDCDARAQVARQIGAAWRAHGFFCVTGHGMDARLMRRLEALSRAFFAQDLASKRRIAMVHGGRAWRGCFALGDELTSGVPDREEGPHLGTELAPDHPLVCARTPMHGANLFPDLAGFRETVLDYIAALTALGHRLLAAIALSLELEADYCARRYSADPLTLLLQDENGGLEVHSEADWIDAPPLMGNLVCNIGDMLDRMKRGLYRSTPHRVRVSARRDRLSFPLFFDPGFHARVQPIEGLPARADDRATRWDGRSVHAFEGRSGDYRVSKVSKVFPQLSNDLV